MCTINLLKTKPGHIKTIIKREEGNAGMSFLQIQYYNDCIRAYATKVNKPIDIAFKKIVSNDLLSIIDQAYHENLKVFMTVRRMQASLNSHEIVSRNR